MDIIKHIQTLLREIEVYRSHGLYKEAMQRCRQLSELVLQSDRIKNKQKVLDAVSKKIEDIENDARKVDAVEASGHMSTKEQALVMSLFSFSEDDVTDSADLEGATALLVFGQYEKALSEFNELIKRDSLRADAAKNILRCHIGLSSIDNAVTQYQQWLSSGQFPLAELEKIRSFLQDFLISKGIEKSLPEPEVSVDAIPEVSVDAIDVEDHEIDEEELINIVSIEIPLNDELQEEKAVGFDVSFQKENMISVIIPRANQDLIDYFKVGMKLDDVQFFSVAIMFKESCVISAKEQIESGPRRGDCTLVMEILNT
jgi:tetratricopeptide (TPR) repeat protein